MSQLLDKVEDVDIDEDGEFKYILIEVCDKESKATKNIVRGNAGAAWHVDIFDQTNTKLDAIGGLRAKCLGGGRITHNASDKSIQVFGYSVGYGKADHEVTVELLKKKYTDYEITWFDSGY